MPINLFTSFYTDKNEVRNKELLFCLDKNLSQSFDNIVLLMESEQEQERFWDMYKKDDRVTTIVMGKRPTFNDFFNEMNEPTYSKSINILCNSDIFFLGISEMATSIALNVVANYLDKVCFALSRWDYVNDNDFHHFCRADSQDTWIFFGNPQLTLKDIDFTMGVAGCDNRLAHELKQAGYNVLNPSKTIKSFHYHNSGIRNYLVGGEVIERIPPPYLLVEPY